MSQPTTDELCKELESTDSIDKLIELIDNDSRKEKARFKILADADPQRLFELLGGDEFEISTKNWALEYTYEDYINENGLHFDKEQAKKWNLEQESINHAHETAHWYVTGICSIKGANGLELNFEFEYCEGYVAGIIGTPYDEENKRSHGFIF
jgi:hypothetical protein